MTLPTLGVLRILGGGEKAGQTTIYGQTLPGVEWMKVVAALLALPGVQVAKVVLRDPEDGRVGSGWKIVGPSVALQAAIFPAKMSSREPEQRPLLGSLPAEIPPGIEEWFRPLAVESNDRGLILVGHPKMAATWARKAEELLSLGAAQEIAKVYVRRGPMLYYVWRVRLGDPGEAQGDVEGHSEESPPPLPQGPRIRGKMVTVKSLPAQTTAKSLGEYNRKLMAWQASHPSAILAGDLNQVGTDRALEEYRIGLSKLRLGKNGKLAGKRVGENIVTTIPIFDPRPSALSRVITGRVTDAGVGGWSPPSGGAVVDIQPHPLGKDRE